MRKLLIVLILLALVIVTLLSQRHRIVLGMISTGEPTPHIEDAVPVPGGTPFDDHFSVVQLDENTFAIAEPFSWARNVSYLLLGEQRALLFDAGVGHYDIRPVVESLTDLPLIFMPSHFHYDHTGQGEWTQFVLVDLPHVRERAQGNQFSPNWGEHLGDGEGIELPVWDVTEWVKPNEVIDLGGRELTVLYTPGHTNNSVSLLDEPRQLMFTGDFLTSSGAMSSFLPTARLGDYLQSSKKVLARTEMIPSVVFRGAHAAPTNTTPENNRDDLTLLHDGLISIRDGSLTGMGPYPVAYTLKDGTTLTAEPGFLQNWEPTYPDGHEVH